MQPAITFPKYIPPFLLMIIDDGAVHCCVLVVPEQEGLLGHGEWSKSACFLPWMNPSMSTATVLPETEQSWLSQMQSSRQQPVEQLVDHTPLSLQLVTPYKNSILSERYCSKYCLCEGEQEDRFPLKPMQLISRLRTTEWESYCESMTMKGKSRQMQDCSKSRHRHSSPSFLRLHSRKGFSCSWLTSLPKFCKAVTYSLLLVRQLLQLRGQESRMSENLWLPAVESRMRSQKYLDQIRAPTAPNPLPANTTEGILERSYFLAIHSKLDRTTVLPLKYRFLFLQRVGLLAQPWKREASQFGTMTLAQPAQRGSASMPKEKSY